MLSLSISYPYLIKFHDFVLGSGASNAESQYFIPLFNKNFMTLFWSLVHLILSLSISYPYLIKLSLMTLVLEPVAFNAESQYFIPVFNKNFMTLQTLQTLWWRFSFMSSIQQLPSQILKMKKV
jgi:hypothetical protein